MLSSKYAILKPLVKKVESSPGSVHDEQILKIIGNGFSSKLRVYLGTFDCKLISNTFNTIICKASPVSVGIQNIRIK
jgi:hypothetical protein